MSCFFDTISDAMQGDKTTDRLYIELRERYGHNSPLANGYRSRAYFLREQAVLHGLLDPQASTVVDIGCGSGLMLRPLVDTGRLVLGVDFNADACSAAKANGFPVVRGDAFALPFATDSVDEITSCQFFNQQAAEGLTTFAAEAKRVLAPGGRVIIVWRNGSALIHRFAHAGLNMADRLRGLPTFPQFVHRVEEVRAYLSAAGLEVQHEEVSCPPLRWRSRNVTGLMARLIGASCIVIAAKPAS